MEWWQTLIVALVSPVLPTGALFLQQRRAHDREDRVRSEDRDERARDRWRSDRLAAHSLLLVELNSELDAFRDAVEIVFADDHHHAEAEATWEDDHPERVERALAPVQLVGSGHSAGAGEHAYTQLLLARAALAEVARTGSLDHEVARARLRTERQALFVAIDEYRDAARDDLDVSEA